MAHYAHLDPFQIVDQVIVADSNFIASLPDSEQWVQTSYNTVGGVHLDPVTRLPDGGIPVGMNYAGIGFTWDGVGFAAPKPFPSWMLNKSTYQWESPVAMPSDGKPYAWFEPNQEWIALTPIAS